MSNPVVVAYIPPPKIQYPEVFMENLKRFPTKNELLLFSDHDWPGTIKVRSPDMAKGRKNFPQDERRATFSISNLVFLTACRIAMTKNASHMLYVEADSRVGREHWDAYIFEEFFNVPRPLIAAGSMMIYNPCNSGKIGFERWIQTVSANATKNFPIPTYGWKGAADSTGSCVFVNGSLGVYDLWWIRRFFNLDNTVDSALANTAWDMALGLKAWEVFGADCYYTFAHLKSIYSSYGDVLSTEEERLARVRSGEIVACHQVKSSATV